jgi:subtilisin family serine protease
MYERLAISSTENVALKGETTGGQNERTEVSVNSRRLLLLVFTLLIVFSLNANASVQNAPPNWALDRLDQRNGPIDNSYGYTTTGQGVHVYVVDSGINRYHTDFTGRVVVDKDWVDPVWGDGSDCMKHGTAVAGVAAGTLYGVAKQATIHAHKVLGCTYASSTDSEGLAQELRRFVQALNWIRVNHQSPAVVNLSYSRQWPDFSACPENRSGEPSPLDACLEFRDAIAELVNSGVPIVAAAGNVAGPIDSVCASPFGCDPYFGCTCQRWTAQYNLPALADSDVIVVGAARYGVPSPPLDHRLQGTKYLVDVYAPGSSLLTTSTESTTATQSFHNTSAATAVVTGVVARYLQSHPSATPAQVRSWIVSNATSGIIDSVPSWDRRYIYMSPSE